MESIHGSRILSFDVASGVRFKVGLTLNETFHLLSNFSSICTV